MRYGEPRPESLLWLGQVCPIFAYRTGKVRHAGASRHTPRTPPQLFRSKVKGYQKHRAATPGNNSFFVWHWLDGSRFIHLS